MRIRDYAPGDLPAIHAINQAAVPALGSETLEDLGQIADESAIALVVEDVPADGDEPVIAGFCLVLAPGADYDSINYLWFADHYDDFVYLDRVGISPEFQRRGIGTALYAEVERRAASLRPGATVFTLEVNLEPRNDQSLAFHAGLGFIEAGQQRTGYGTLVSLMTKPLAVPS